MPEVVDVEGVTSDREWYKLGRAFFHPVPGVERFIDEVPDFSCAERASPGLSAVLYLAAEDARVVAHVARTVVAVDALFPGVVFG